MLRHVRLLSGSSKLKRILYDKSLQLPIVSCRVLLRKFSSENTNINQDKIDNKVPTEVDYTPPFPVRVALVSTTVGLFTPLFATLGVGALWWSYLPKTPMGRISKYSIGVLIGGGGATLIYQHVLPFLQCHSEVVLPFALANAVTAGVWYSVAERTFGLKSIKNEPPQPIIPLSSASSSQHTRAGDVSPRGLASLLSMFQVNSKVPLIGAGVGALTALTSPMLWPSMFQLCFPDPSVQHLLRLDDSVWLIDVYSWIALCTDDYFYEERRVVLTTNTSTSTNTNTNITTSNSNSNSNTSTGPVEIVTVSVNVRTGELVLDGGTLAQHAAWIHFAVRLVSAFRRPFERVLFSSRDKTVSGSTLGVYEGRRLNLLTASSVDDAVYLNSPASVFVDTSGTHRFEGHNLVSLSAEMKNKHVSTAERPTFTQRNIRLSSEDMRARRDLYLLLDLLLPYIHAMREEALLSEALSKVKRRRANVEPLSPPLKALSAVWPLASADLLLRYVLPEVWPRRSEFISIETVAAALACSLLISASRVFMDKDEKKQSLASVKMAESELTGSIKQLQSIRACLMTELKSQFNVSGFNAVVDEYIRRLEVSMVDPSSPSNQPTSSFFSLQRQPESLDQWLATKVKKYNNSMPGELTDVSPQLLRSTGMLLANLEFVKKELDG